MINISILHNKGEYSDQFALLNSLVAQLDVFCSYATFILNSSSQLVRPELLPSEEGLIDLKDMKHPLLEKFLDGYVVPNDVKLNKDDSTFHVITGPNMGGKSTFIRTTALMVFLAQIGCHVPCTHATISIVDAILVRIGADDNINKGISTFMGEMLDTCSILKNSTNNSLVIIDELGRGTSTYDGLGLTWSISQHIHDSIGCFCMFATHFHEMTSLAKICPKVTNFYSTATESSEGITMLYRIEQGVSHQSYGLNVAKVTGFPQEVIDQSELNSKEYELLLSNNLIDELETDKKIEDFLSKIDMVDDEQKENLIAQFKGECKSSENSILKAMSSF